MTSVMVVDDHALVRTALVALIESTDDLTVAAVAADGREAIRLVRAVRPDVVLTDLSMPGLDGVATIRAITAMVPQTRVVLLTSSQNCHWIDEAMEAGAVECLVKGRDCSAVLDAVRRAASRIRV